MVKRVSYIVPASNVKKCNILPFGIVYCPESMQVGKSGCNLCIPLDLVRRNKESSRTCAWKGVEEGGQGPPAIGLRTQAGLQASCETSRKLKQLIPEAPGQVCMNQGELCKGEKGVFEPSECRGPAKALCKVLPRSIPETNDLLTDGLIGLAVYMSETALTRNGPGEQQKSSRPNMPIECLKERRLMLCGDMFSDLETENAIHRRANKGWIGEIGNRAMLKGRGQRIPIEPLSVETRGTEGLDIVSKPASEVVRRPDSVLSEN